MLRLLSVAFACMIAASAALRADRRCRLARPAVATDRAVPGRQQHRHRRPHPGQRLAAKLGQQVVIDNRAGASGNIGADAVAKAAPDGYTLGIATASTHALAVSLSANLPYDPIKDFAPVGMIGGQPYVLVIYPGLPAKNLGELIALAKTKPGTLNYGSAGVASLAHLAAALFANQAGVSLTHVPYKSSAQSVTDMITGRLEMQFATIAPTLATIRDGKLRALVTTGAQALGGAARHADLAESGLPGYEAVLWMALVMPPGTPAAIVTRLNRDLNDILKTPDAREALIAQGVEPEPGPPDGGHAAHPHRHRQVARRRRQVRHQAGVRRRPSAAHAVRHSPLAHPARGSSSVQVGQRAQNARRSAQQTDHRESAMRFVIALLTVAFAPPAFAQDVPQFRPEPFWPKPLPENWILGQVSGIAVDKNDHIWIVHRPASLLDDEKGALAEPAADQVLQAGAGGDEVRCRRQSARLLGRPVAGHWIEERARHPRRSPPATSGSAATTTATRF